MNPLLDSLGITNPVLAAPMAGGATTPELVISAGEAGSLGFLASGYTPADALAARMAAVRDSGVAFGVNLFAPNPVPISAGEFASYARRLQADADVFGLDLSTSSPLDDDDDWQNKLDVLLSDPVPAVSFTFGIPSTEVIAALKRAGSRIIQTITSVDEAKQAAEAGVDALVVQSWEAGGHSGTLTPNLLPLPIPLADLVASVSQAVTIPLIAAGGISSAGDVAVALRSGASAVSVGTALLRANESGASSAHRAALADPAFAGTAITRAFTGRPARGLYNGFMIAHSDEAPLGYPAVHHLTSPLRKAAAAAGDTQRMHLWAGTGFASAEAGPVEDILNGLAAGA
ncbi:nitronate monooxygenase [Lysinibacter cavernae]|uniref:Propionate 3-nitronate monooxygenase n=1 Tax=Lysinibacter cavernae TaxID=1640652 RepID=A0A7X5R002_9MICO|nr:nitronate monooxygenase [Lysinibacter cavernae]NIH52925.1 NAD(P)H-dependent flavin oxidoreductase YrpB (nitropropane dioxygenase family) [Lysinibacter cavernae]